MIQELVSQLWINWTSWADTHTALTPPTHTHGSQHRSRLIQHIWNTDSFVTFLPEAANMFKFPPAEIEETIEVGSDLWGVKLKLEKTKTPKLFSWLDLDLPLF